MSPCDKYGNIEDGCLWPQHMKIIKLPNSNFSPAFYNYAWPKEKKKKKIWNTGRGVWYHMAAQTQLPKHFKNKQGTFLFPLSNHMWAQHVRSSLQVGSDRLFVFWLLVVFSWKGVTVRSLQGKNQYHRSCRTILEVNEFFEEERCVIQESFSSTRGKPAFGMELFWELFRGNYWHIFYPNEFWLWQTMCTQASLLNHKNKLISYMKKRWTI